MCRLVRPSATSASTSTSRRVRPSEAAADGAFTLVADGSVDSLAGQIVVGGAVEAVVVGGVDTGHHAEY
jgi:hypothetical protein